MPELPEVETIARELRKKIVGLRFVDAWADWPRSIRQAGGLENLRKQIKNKKIQSVSRRAKYVIINIEGPKTIFVHQKISGHLLYGKWKLEKGVWLSRIPGPLTDDNRNQYLRIVFDLSNGYQLALSDLRRFGKIILVDDDRLGELKEIRELGPEPLEIGFNVFKKLFDKKRGVIKQVLMDPRFIAGIGNIYSDEILWDSGYHPLSRAEHFKEKDLKKLFKSTRKILKKAVELQGSSMDDYRLPSGKKGRFQDVQFAYHRTKDKCAKRDGGVISRLRVAGRSAHFCPKHQPII